MLPARSACFTSVVYVGITCSRLCQRLKNEIIEELASKRAVELKELEKRTTEQATRQLDEMGAIELKKMGRQVLKQIKEKLPGRTVGPYIIKHNMEDFVLEDMAIVTGDNASQEQYRMDVEFFFPTIPSLWYLTTRSSCWLRVRRTVQLPLIILISNKQIRLEANS